MKTYGKTKTDPIGFTEPVIKKTKITDFFRPIHAENVGKSTNAKKSSPELIERKLKQTFLDVGQRNLHSKTCDICAMVYDDYFDRKYHLKYHNKYVQNMKQLLNFPSIRCLKHFDCDVGKMVVVNGNMANKHVRRIVNTINGLIDAVELKSGVINKSRLYFLLEDRTVVSFCMVECIKEAERYCAETEQRIGPVNVVMGVSRIWTAVDRRRKSFAQRLLDWARQTFAFESAIERSQIAFSYPTTLGTKFAVNYFKSSIINVYG